MDGCFPVPAIQPAACVEAVLRCVAAPPLLRFSPGHPSPPLQPESISLQQHRHTL